MAKVEGVLFVLYLQILDLTFICAKLEEGCSLRGLRLTRFLEVSVCVCKCVPNDVSG